ncbi:4-hydroxy-3-methylbut-2-en-1-yl diphosphate synthase (ferredoxin), chloroplastic [Iris pallida]|uniref:4-hydroxy-3-methylbut-2-en-1-yl diphosphate synthase (Ferredoxin), chloroplastic n=1 Tax=Iris pallida TaxID=29817 RepID=A0AAX6DGJ8_IRIPA|nr:4-hydroxy-3-methylbut-2-en-1-yl diphosphate synthase (ferredoxin), chloroplastic [Iris pallida]
MLESVGSVDFCYVLVIDHVRCRKHGCLNSRCVEHVPDTTQMVVLVLELNGGLNLFWRKRFFTKIKNGILYGLKYASLRFIFLQFSRNWLVQYCKLQLYKRGWYCSFCPIFVMSTVHRTHEEDCLMLYNYYLF